jgi:hypothetical protein
MSRRSAKRLLPWVIIVCTGLVCAAFVVEVSPVGQFDLPQVGNTADAYLEIRGGKVTRVVWDGESGRSGLEHRCTLGDYRKENGRWVLVDSESGRRSELRTTLFSLVLIEPDGRKEGPFRRLWK